MYASAVAVVAPFVVPAAWWLVPLNVALNAHDLYTAARSYEQGDLAAVGEYVIVTALDRYLDGVELPQGVEPVDP